MIKHQIFVDFVDGELLPRMRYNAICLQGEDDYLRLLLRAVFALDVGAKHVEIVSKSEGFKGLVEGYFGLSDYLHRHLIVEIDEVVLFLNYVCVVIRVEIDGLNSG